MATSFSTAPSLTTTSATLSFKRCPTPPELPLSSWAAYRGLDVLGEDRDADPGMVGSQGNGRSQSLVEVGGWHAHVHHGHVGDVFGYRLDQGLAIGHGGNHIVSPIGE